MKALVYTAPNEVRYRDEPDPVRADGEVMLAIDAVGIDNYMPLADWREWLPPPSCRPLSPAPLS